MTTELPSGDISSPVNSTALKNSSMVIFGLAWGVVCGLSWAIAVSAHNNTRLIVKLDFWMDIGFPVGKSVIQRPIRPRQVCDLGSSKRSQRCPRTIPRASQRSMAPKVAGESTARAGPAAAEGQQDKRARGASTTRRAADSARPSARSASAPERAPADRKQKDEDSPAPPPG